MTYDKPSHIEIAKWLVKGKHLALDNRHHRKEDALHQLPAKGNHLTLWIDLNWLHHADTVGCIWLWPE